MHTFHFNKLIWLMIDRYWLCIIDEPLPDAVLFKQSMPKSFMTFWHASSLKHRQLISSLIKFYLFKANSVSISTRGIFFSTAFHQLHSGKSCLHLSLFLFSLYFIIHSYKIHHRVITFIKLSHMNDFYFTINSHPLVVQSATN